VNKEQKNGNSTMANVDNSATTQWYTDYSFQENKKTPKKT